MASGCKFFDEDAVYRINKRKLVDFGLVLENSEFVSSDEEDSDEKNIPEWDRMKRGHVRVAWHPKGVEEVLPERKVRLFDRSLMPGDVVRKLIKGKDTQLGYCRNTNVRACVQVLGTKQVVAWVDSKDLMPVEDFSVDIAVFLNSWVGMVKAVKCEITVKCSDGSRGVMLDIDAFDLDDLLDRRDRTSEYKKYSFYPGQQLWGPSYCFENVKWSVLNKEMEEILLKPSRSIRVTVEDVKIVSLGVQWVCRAYSEDANNDNLAEQPCYHVTEDLLKEVKMMNIFEPCALQIGNRNFLIVKETDRIMSLEEWRKEMALTLSDDSDSPTLKKKNSQDSSDNKENVGVCVEQNGVYEHDSEFEDIEDDEEEGNSSDSASVTSHSTASSVDKSKTSSKHKSRKGFTLVTRMLKKKKLKRARRNLMKEVLPLKPGDRVVTETLIIETKANVVWQDGTVETDIPSSQLYPIHHLDGHEFFPGDFVIESKDSKPHEYGVVKHVDHSGRTASVTWMKTYHAGADPHPETITEQEVSVYDIKDHPDFKYRPGSCVIRVANFEDSDPASTAGQVVDVHPTGKVEVSWVSGKMSLCYPQELYRVGEYDSDDLWGDDDTFGDEDSWETESEGSIVGIEEGNQIVEKPLEENIVKEGEKIAAKAQEKEDKSSDVSKSVQEKLLANIEKLRAGMARLEEVFTQNPTLQTCNVMRRLLELYKHCKVLDQLLGTTYFHERHLQALVDQLRHRGRVNSLQHMADQISRLFSITVNEPGSEASEATLAQTTDELNSCLESTKDSIESVTEAARIELNEIINSSDSSTLLSSENPLNKVDSSGDTSVKTSGALLSPVEVPVTGNESRNICQQLCTMLKTRLLKAHENVERRFGMSPNTATTAMLAAENDSSPKQESNGVSSQSELVDLLVVNNEASIKELSMAITDDDTQEKEDVDIMSTAGQGIFKILEAVPDSHKYKLSILQPTDPRAFFRTVKKEMQLLNTSLPEGIIVKGFEDRIDLYSALIKGPKRTPYEDGLFFFDFQLPADYPKNPPLCHYISYCSDRLNPNLYEGGKVCVSLLGTWGGKGTEVWSSTASSLLQVIVSIQGLILVSEPYFNEAGYERQRGTQQGRENSRMYNEMVVLKLVQATSNLLLCPPEVFKEEILEHFRSQAPKLVSRLELWLKISEEWNANHPASPTSPTVFKEIHNDSFDSSNTEIPLPEFALIPASKGFCLTLRKSLVSFKEVLTSANIPLS